MAYRQGHSTGAERVISSTDGDGARLALGPKISENWPENAIL